MQAGVLCRAYAFIEIDVAKVEGWLLGNSHLAIVENCPLVCSKQSKETNKIIHHIITDGQDRLSPRAWHQIITKDIGLSMSTAEDTNKEETERIKSNGTTTVFLDMANIVATGG